MNNILNRTYRPTSNLLSSYVNELKFWIYMRATKDHHVTTVATEKIFIDNFTDLKCDLHSVL